MTALSLAGSGLILLASLLLAHSLTAAEKASLVQTEAYLALLRLIRGQIACYSRPFAEICRRIAPQTLAACGLGTAGDSLDGMLRQADLFLPAEAERIVREFAGELGRGYKTEQLAVCDAAIADLDAIAEAARRRLPEKLRLCRVCCVCGGLAVILLLI